MNWTRDLEFEHLPNLALLYRCNCNEKKNWNQSIKLMISQKLWTENQKRTNWTYICILTTSIWKPELKYLKLKYLRPSEFSHFITITFYYFFNVFGFFLLKVKILTFFICWNKWPVVKLDFLIALSIAKLHININITLFLKKKMEEEVKGHSDNSWFTEQLFHTNYDKHKAY